MRSLRRGGPDFDSNAKILMVIAAVLAAIVAGKLVYLQVFEASSLSRQAEAMRTNTVTIQAKRGTIYDRNGNVLAMSQDCTTIYCNPNEVQAGSIEEAAKILAEDTGADESDFLSILTQDTTFAYLKRKVDNSVAGQVKEDLAKANISGVYYLSDVRRVYPYGSVGSQVLGIVGTDGDGLTGLELYYNDILKGTDGEMIFETGSGGTPIAGETAQTKEAKDGTDIVISLDIDIQKVAEETIAQGVKDYSADSGSVMVTDPTTGEILAACSTPMFDVTDTSTIEDGATSLKLVSSSFEPGSIFKLLTMAIGIDNGLITPDSTFDVPAKVQVGSDWVGDDDNRSYEMNMSVREILRRSSNAGTALVAQQVIGADTFASGIEKFGIGSKTGIDFPGEVAGIVKTREHYDNASLGAMSFGQSLAIPLVQMVKAVDSIADDGTLTTPHFLVKKGGETVKWKSTGTSVSKETADQVTDMMRTVVQEGTATAAQVDGYDVAGKTGTGEQAGETGSYIANSYVSSLIGFANADDPKVMVYVGLNGTPYLATSSAAPLFSTIMSAALSDLGVEPTSGTSS